MEDTQLDRLATRALFRAHQRSKQRRLVLVYPCIYFETSCSFLSGSSNGNNGGIGEGTMAGITVGIAAFLLVLFP